MAQSNIQIRVSGDPRQSSTDIIVSSKQDEIKLLTSICNQGEIGFMEAYIDGLWSCQNLKGLFEKLMATSAASDLKTFSVRVAH